LRHAFGKRHLLFFNFQSFVNTLRFFCVNKERTNMPPLSALLDRLVRMAAVLLVLSLLASVMIGVISRQFNRPVIWSDEMAQNLLVWTGFIGWMIAARKRSHIRITIFIDRLPRTIRLAAEVVIQLSVIVLALALLRYGTPLIERNWDIEWISLPLSSGLLYLPIPFAALVLIGQAIVDIRFALAGRQYAAPEIGSQPL
jgi:TRAP-type transport system small permease protein